MALLLHIVVAIALSTEFILKIIFPEKKVEDVAEVEPAPKPVMSFTITPKARVVPVAPELPKPEPPKPKPKLQEKQQYAHTSDEQPKGKPKGPKFYGDADTVAQSNAETDPNAAAMPSVAGERKDGFSMASRFQEGSLEHENRSVVSEQPQPAPAEPPTPKAEPAKPTPQLEIAKTELKPAKQSDAETSLAGSSLPMIDYLDAANKLPSERKVKDPVTESLLNDIKKAEREKAVKEQLKEVAKKESRPKERAKPRTTKIADSGFSAEREASKVVGSISRRGKISSLDVEGTPLGKYKKSVQDTIAQEWYKRTGRNSDLIKPGTIQVIYLVYANGRVKVVDLNVLQGSEIQTGITLQSITSAKIPKLPNALKNDLKGEPVEMSTTFNFLN